jgi:hypothetical protein
MLTLVNALKALVKNGRIIVDQPTDLPEGTELYLVPADDPHDDMDDGERAELEASIDEGLADVDAGDVTDFGDYIASLRARRA